jgi:hypothetical protein
LASQNDINSYPNSSELGYSCRFLDLWKEKFLLAHDRVFLAVEGEQEGEDIEVYFLLE